MTGFDDVAPFPTYLHSLYGDFFTISQNKLAVQFHSEPPSNSLVKTGFTQPKRGGRVVKIIAVNGAPVAIESTIDTGNESFLSYASDSPLAAASQFPFNVTFAGGNTLVFESAPKVNGVITSAKEYTHNVLALGFMSPFDVTFDHASKQLYFSN